MNTSTLLHSSVQFNQGNTGTLLIDPELFYNVLRFKLLSFYIHSGSMFSIKCPNVALIFRHSFLGDHYVEFSKLSQDRVIGTKENIARVCIFIFF